MNSPMEELVRQGSIQARCLHPAGMFTEFKRDEIQQSISKRFEKQVKNYSGRIAINTRNCQFTYDMLDKAANRVAQAILAQRGEREEPVALLFDHDAPMITAILGALKAGKIYVPLAPSFPRARTAYMLENSQAGLIVTNNRNFHPASELAQHKCQLLNIDETSLSEENPGLSISPDAFAYILYTSGSTGRPKGVIGRHRDVLHEIMRITNDNHICAEDRHALLSHASVSGSIRDMYGSLLNGASLFLFNLEEEGIANLANWLFQQEVTIFRSVATLFRQFTKTLTGEERFPKLRLIHLGGEPVYKRDIGLYKTHFSQDCIFLNGLGITEAGLVCRYLIDKETQIDANNVPIGYAIEDMDVLLLNDAGERVGFNCIGEIAVKSRYISPGYWRMPDLTQATFMPDPEGEGKRIYRTGDMGYMLPDGCVVHVGRKDFQVKIGGHRVEVAEIETALLELDAVEDAVVIAREDRHGNQRLAAYIIPAGQYKPTIGSLRRSLSEKLPGYMIPAYFMMLDAFPLTPTGKIDRMALPIPGTARPELGTPFIAPRDTVEKLLADIWAQVLALDQVGIHDDFLELGGNSLLATQVISRVLSTFRIKVDLKHLFQSLTVADMALVITQCQAQVAKQEDIESILSELESLSDEEAQKLLTDF